MQGRAGGPWHPVLPQCSALHEEPMRAAPLGRLPISTAVLSRPADVYTDVPKVAVWIQRGIRRLLAEAARQDAAEGRR